MGATDDVIYETRTSSTSRPSAPQRWVDSPVWRLAAASSGFLADAYDLFAIDLVVLILDKVYGADEIDTTEKSVVVSAMIAGVIIGQLTFGFLADWFGRKWTFVLTAALTVFGALASSCSMRNSRMTLAAQLAICRFVLGLGVGGEYPLVATVTSETAHSAADRGWYLVLVLSSQGFGMLLSSVVALIALSMGAGLEVTWRLLLAFGAFPSLVAFVLRWHMHESESFEKDVGERRSLSQTTATIRRYWHPLIGTTCCWLLANISFYSLGSFKSTIFDMLVQHGGDKVETVRSTAWMAALTSGFAILGFVLAMALINRLGRFYLQFGGFIAVACVLAVTAGLAGGNLESSLVVPHWFFVVLLGLMFTFQNCGPNSTTFVLPAEVFPTRVRATCHGMSAASGKVGAWLGTMAFPPMEASVGLPIVFGACSLAALLGASVTYVFTPRESVDISELEDEHAPLAVNVEKPKSQG